MKFERHPFPMGGCGGIHLLYQLHEEAQIEGPKSRSAWAKRETLSQK
jgi:hypothetical protein